MNGKFIVTLVVVLLCVAATIIGVMMVDEPSETLVITESQTESDNSEGTEENKTTEEEKPAEEILDEDLTDTWELLLANPDNPLPEDFTVETAAVQGDFMMDARVADVMKQMIADAKEDGVDLMVCSAYRSISRQQELFDAEVAVQMANGKSKEEAEAVTATMIAVPGTSEHHTGLAADIVTPTHQTLDPEFADTDAGKWLQEHAVEYGFILRYPEDKQDITQIIYESWHYRYVGVEHAKAITEQGLCLEEYLEQLRGE
ncbi:MAG: M15 family metallopeptidase [Oscillospiraceae bacterium]|nr:M15 family metallopeptidase [Oscillospiraceae bacterium]